MSQGRFEDLSGKAFRKLTVQYRAADHVQPSGQHKRVWHCKCECGNECDVRASDLKTGNTKSCGCFQESRRGQSYFEDLTGQQFGRLTVLYRLPNHVTPSGQKKVMWRCKCTCGNECDEYSEQLKKSLVLSCGCIAREKSEKRAAAKKIVSTGQAESSDELTDYFVKRYISQRTRKKETAAKKSAVRRKEQLEIESLAAKCPSLLAEWNYRLNGSLTPYEVTAGSGKSVWWRGSCGHEWQAVISSRVRGNGCPYCSSQKVLSGYNDLATVNPKLAREWDYNKNGSLLPSDVTPHSTKKVWWLCSLGHSYVSTVSNRERTGCPYCSIPAKKVLKGFNDLKSQYPRLAEEWHPTKNGPLAPDDVLCGSTKKVWWLGKCGHEYEQGIASRVNGGNCPFCSHQKLLQGFNDFATEHPELVKEWDAEKNDCDPNEIMSHSHYRAWWICPFGHSYQAWMGNRCGEARSGCPVCDKENHTSFPEQAVFYYIQKSFPDAINSDRSQIGMELDIFISNYKNS